MPPTLTRIDISAYRVPIEQPVATSFGVMTNRPAVFVRLEDSDGAFGFGEIFANWPAAGAEHRVRLVDEDLKELLLGRRFDGPRDLFENLSQATRIRALQSGEWGPFRQAIAGLDTAYRDLLARQDGVPLHRALNPEADDAVPCYASGIAIAQAQDEIAKSLELGFSAFKVKVGFNLERDAETVRSISSDLPNDTRLFADANQAWDLDAATSFLNAIEGVPLGWLEEPLPADASDADWRALAQRTEIPLAVGENITGEDSFERAANSGVFGILQPDVAKWGGVTGCWDVARTIRVAGPTYCPHFLGGGVGLAASAHLLAATSGPGVLEVDVNPNPLRDAFNLWSDAQGKGTLLLSDAPGLGISEIPEEIAQFRTHHVSLRA